MRGLKEQQLGVQGTILAGDTAFALMHALVDKDAGCPEEAQSSIFIGSIKLLFVYDDGLAVTVGVGGDAVKGRVHDLVLGDDMRLDGPEELDEEEGLCKEWCHGVSLPPVVSFRDSAGSSGRGLGRSYPPLAPQRRHLGGRAALLPSRFHSNDAIIDATVLKLHNDFLLVIALPQVLCQVQDALTKIRLCLTAQVRQDDP